MQAIKDLVPFRFENIKTLRIRKVLSFSVIFSVIQLSSFGFQISIAPNANAASTGAVSSYVVSTGGGGGLGQSNCPTGSVIYQVHSTKISFDGSYAMSDVYALCYGLSSNGLQTSGYVSTTTHYGSSTGTLENRDCGNSSKVISGARVWKTANGYASGIELYCRDMPGAADPSSDVLTGTLLGSTGSGGSNYNDLKCPAGTVAIGLYMYSGSILDKFGFNCGPITGVTQSSITSVTLSLTSKTYPYSANLYVDSIVGGSGNGDFLISSIANGTASGCAYSSLTISSSSSGTCTVTVTKQGDTNYAATSKTETFTFNKAALTVTASSHAVNLGDAKPSISPIYSGFVNSENSSSSSFTTGLVAPTCTTSYTTATPVDTSPITTCSGGSSVGYSFNYVTGRVIILSGTDNSISLNGTTQYANVAGAQVIPTSTSDTFTVETWIYPTSANANSVILSQGPTNNRFYLKRGTDEIIRFYRSGHASESACGKAPQDAWTHIAIVVGTAQSKCYLNGSLYNTFAVTSTTSIGTGFAIGQYSASLGSSGYHFVGKIDEVKIWSTDRSLNVSDDLKTYNPDASGLTAYFDFNEMIGSALFNRSSTGSVFDLTSQNAPSLSPIATSTIYQAYTVVTFPRSILTATGGWKSPANVNSIRYLVVGGGGGGGGGFNGGGGGAGGYRETNTAILPNTIYKIDVGVGGLGAANRYSNTSGKSSSITRLSLATDSITASGGGKGATEQQSSSGPYALSTPDGKNESGGSGGGGSHGATNATTWGTNVSGAPGNAGGYSPVEGYKGGDGASGTGYYAGGGGGGAGSIGTNADASTTGLPGNGGAGVTSYITGTAIDFAGGGAGAGRFAPSITYVKHGTATHGGGSGACAAVPCATNTDTGTAGTANTGGGGGAGASEVGTALGGNGGSGFIAIRYITDTPTILVQPASDTTTAGIVETFTVTTSEPPAPLTKSVQWQFTTDTVTGTTGWTNVSSGTGGNSDTFTTLALTKSMNKYRFRAIVTFSDTSTLSIVETSSVAILTINDSITITSDTSTITRKYGSAQTPPRTITYSGGTTVSGAVGTSTSHTVRGAYGTLASGKIILDTTTSAAVFIVDTGTSVGTYIETITVTDFKGATATYTQRVVVTQADTLTVQADTLTVQADTLTAITYNPAGMTINPTVTISGLVASDTSAAVTYTFSEAASTCASGGSCSLGDTGPGGGTIFYISGSTYYEAAPKNWYSTVTYRGSTYDNSFVKFCSDSNGVEKNVNFGFTASTGWGGGKTNTTAFVNNGCPTGAIALSQLYQGGSKTDWYVPNATEINELHSYWNSRGAISSQFTNVVGGNTPYWTSNASWSGNTWGWIMTYPFFNSSGTWDPNGAAYNTQSGAIIPIRYFTASGGTQNLVGNPTNAGTYTITPSALTLANGVDTNNYVNVVYRSSQFVINKAAQSLFNVTSKLGDFKGNPSAMKLGTSGGTDTGTITFAIASGGTAGGCSISGESLTVTSVGTCNVVATKASTRNYLIAYSDTVTITFSLFVSHQPVQTQSVPTQLPINGANALETATLTVPIITSVVYDPGGTRLVNGNFQNIAPSYTINGSGFTGASRVVLNFNDFTPFTILSDTAINVPAPFGSTPGVLFIECEDGRIGPTPFYNFNP